LTDQSKIYVSALQELTVRYERLVQALSILKELDRLDTPDIEFDQICRHLVETIASGLAAENCSLMLLDDNGEQLELKAACGPFQDQGSLVSRSDDGKKIFVLGKGIVGLSGESGDIYRIDDVTQDDRFVTREDTVVTIRSLLCFPLLETGKLIGVLNLSHSSPGFFTVESERTLSLIADRVARILSVHALQQKLKESEEHFRHVAKMEALGTLAGGIAHDFNNILQVIVGFGEIAAADAEPESQQIESIQEILIAAERGSALAEQILAFSRQTEQVRKPMRLQPILREVSGLLRGSIPASTTIVEKIDEGCGPVLADATSIHQVVMNLCTNAFHAMKEVGGQLTISYSEVKSGSDWNSDLEARPYAQMIIKDTGHGIPETVIKRIFEPYFTTKASGEGTGLGLATVHGIIKSNQGLITVHSKVESGTEFRIFLPRYSRVPKKDLKPPVKEIQTGKERILFVDDEVQIAELGRRILEKLGYSVEVKNSGVEALELLRSNPNAFDILITDLTMPNLTGLDLAHRAKELRSDLPIIIATGFSESITDKSAVFISGIIKKPFVTDDLASEIRKVRDNAK